MDNFTWESEEEIKEEEEKEKRAEQLKEMTPTDAERLAYLEQAVLSLTMEDLGKGEK